MCLHLKNHWKAFNGISIHHHKALLLKLAIAFNRYCMSVISNGLGISGSIPVCEFC